jgi:hypothetical protein
MRQPSHPPRIVPTAPVSIRWRPGRPVPKAQRDRHSPAVPSCCRGGTQPRSAKHVGGDPRLLIVTIALSRASPNLMSSHHSPRQESRSRPTVLLMTSRPVTSRTVSASWNIPFWSQERIIPDQRLDVKAGEATNSRVEDRLERSNWRATTKRTDSIRKAIRHIRKKGASTFRTKASAAIQIKCLRLAPNH